MQGAGGLLRPERGHVLADLKTSRDASADAFSRVGVGLRLLPAARVLRARSGAPGAGGARGARRGGGEGAAVRGGRLRRRGRGAARRGGGRWRTSLGRTRGARRGGVAVLRGGRAAAHAAGVGMEAVIAVPYLIPNDSPRQNHPNPIMFLHELGRQQQHAFLGLARRIIEADDHLAEQEEQTMELLRREMDLAVVLKEAEDSSRNRPRPSPSRSGRRRSVRSSSSNSSFSPTPTASYITRKSESSTHRRRPRCEQRGARDHAELGLAPSRPRAGSL